MPTPILASPVLVSMMLLVQPAEPAAPHTLVQTDRLVETIKALPTKRAAMASDEHKAGLRQTEAWLFDQLTAMGLAPQRHSFVWGSPAALVGEPTVGEADLTWNNIIVDLKGTDLPQEVLVVGAHFDAVPMGPGADDNATGTAAVLELARVLKDRPMRRTVRLALFNLEEAGLVGSSAYVVDWRKKNPVRLPATPGGEIPPLPPGQETIHGMMSLEMLGYFSDEPNSQRSPLPAQPGVFEPPTVGDSIAVVGLQRDRSFIRKLATAFAKAEPDLKVTKVDFLPTPIPDMTRSDHRPFMAMKVPAVMVTDTANFRNPNYHKATDTLDTLDLKRYTQVVRAVAAAVYTLAEPAGTAPDPAPAPAPAAPSNP